MVIGRLNPKSAASFLSEWHRQIAGGKEKDQSSIKTTDDGLQKGSKFELNEGLNVASLVVDALDIFHATTDRSMVGIYGLSDDGTSSEMSSDASRGRLEEFARAIIVSVLSNQNEELEQSQK